MSGPTYMYEDSDPIEQPRDPATIDYNKAIVDAAKVWYFRYKEDELVRSKETASNLAAALTRLGWMIDASVKGWNPADYVPEV